MQYKPYGKEEIKKSITGKIERYFGCKLSEATQAQIYKAVSSTVRDEIMQKWRNEKEQRRVQRAKRLYYLSAEFLTGRSLPSNIMNLCAKEEYKQAFNELGINMPAVVEQEPEPGLGNGGLGRLAACFMDSLASLNLPATGSTIRYEYGLFRQRIIDGYQVELPDSWLENGNEWEIPVPEETVEVRFGGTVQENWSGGTLKIQHNDYKTVLAVPYDIPIIGYATAMVNTLRLWSARSPERIDMESFNRGDYARAIEERELAEVISKVLYPEDNHYEGKLLRLKQYYFFTSATIQHAVREYKAVHGLDFTGFPQRVAIHINDTHPGLAIPELMRVLMDEEGLPWHTAQSIAKNTIAYTNHTVMAEALERWPVDMVKTLLPRIYLILQELNKRLCDKLWKAFPGQWDRIGNMAIIAYDMVHMANLCVSMTHTVNGVSQLHSNILKSSTFHDFYLVYPEKFIGITNGITHRRWLTLANPGLDALLEEAIGGEFRKNPAKLEELAPLADDAAFLDKFMDVKRKNKQRLADWYAAQGGGMIDPHSIFDVHAKRLHEYKRQLLNALHILVLYNRIADDASYEMTPRTFIFSAKASPGYARAKLIIKLINSIADLVNKHPRAQELINVVFLENYRVSVAEVLIPAADVSEQLSTAGKEASGTGNMKFMMNGAVTIGTMDGANVEIFNAVGRENIFIFGLTNSEVDAIYRSGQRRSSAIYETNAEIRRAMLQMIDGTLSPDNPHLFQDIYHSLLFGDNGGLPDPYLVLSDFNSYATAQRDLARAYANKHEWAKMTVLNTAHSGFFASDRTIEEYNRRIWHLKQLKFDAVGNIL